MKEKAKISASLLSELCFVGKWTLIVGIIVNIIAGIWPDTSFDYMLWRLGIDKIFDWPWVLILGFAVAVVMMVFRHTVVIITKDEICISKLMSRKSFYIDSFVKSSVERKEHIISFGYYTTVKVSLIFNEPHGRGTYELPGFDEEKLEIIHEKIRLQKAENTTLEEKIEMQDELDSGVSSVFNMPSNYLIQCEKMRLRKYLKLVLGLMAVTGLMILMKMYQDEKVDGAVLVILVIIVFCLAVLVIEHLSLTRKQQLCAECISINSMYIWIRNDCYSLSSIISIKLVSPRKTYDFDAVVQYYMEISTNNKYIKYWLGASDSFREYGAFCSTLEKALVNTPGKISYSM